MVAAVGGGEGEGGGVMEFGWSSSSGIRSDFTINSLILRLSSSSCMKWSEADFLRAALFYVHCKKKYPSGRTKTHTHTQAQ